MLAEVERVLCRFDLSNQVRHGLGSLYEWIISTAHGHGVHGGTVVIGEHGLAADGTAMRDRAWAVSHERPVTIELIDGGPSIQELLRIVEPAFRHGTIALRTTRVLAGTIVEGGTNAATARATTMKEAEDGVLLRIFIGESDRAPGGHRALYEALIERAHEAHLAGATVVRGHIGFGRHSRVHSAKFLELSTGLPIVVEIIDTADKVKAFLPVVEELVAEGLVTVDDVRMTRYP